MDILIISNNFTTLPVSENIQVVNLEQSLLLNFPDDLKIVVDRIGISTKQVFIIQNKFPDSQLLILNNENDWLHYLEPWNWISLESLRINSEFPEQYEEDKDQEEPFQNAYRITCEHCHKELRMTYTDHKGDGYYTECENGHKGFISVHTLDLYMEYCD